MLLTALYFKNEFTRRKSKLLHARISTENTTPKACAGTAITVKDVLKPLRIVSTKEGESFMQRGCARHAISANIIKLKKTRRLRTS